MKQDVLPKLCGAISCVILIQSLKSLFLPTINSTHEISTSSSVNFMAFWLRFGFILSSREVKNVSSSTSLLPKYDSMKPNLSQKAMKLGPNDTASLRNC